MSASAFLQRQIAQIRRGGRPVFSRKLRKASRLLLAPLCYALAVPAVFVVRLIRPWLLIRFAALQSYYFGHFAGDTEMYLCERDAGIIRPGRRHLDLFYMREPPCNLQLATMWKRVLRVWPEWLLAPTHQIDCLLRGDPLPDYIFNTQYDRDVYNLLDRSQPHLRFTAEEEARGAAGLQALGIAQGRPFVCLNVRDNAWNAHCAAADPSTYADETSFRCSDVQDYVLAAETLADRGYAVVRTGAIVRQAMNSGHPGVIDYAANGMRSDFMDIFLGAKCDFCISTGTGFDSVPLIFRRPIAFVNYAPLVHLVTCSTKILSIPKHYHSAAGGRELSLAEIVACGAWLVESTFGLRAGGIRLIDNTPEEIRDAVVEMAERLRGTWQAQDEDEALQRRFWEILPRDAPGLDGGRPWHGEIRARFGAAFLRANRVWLDR